MNKKMLKKIISQKYLDAIKDSFVYRWCRLRVYEGLILRLKLRRVLKGKSGSALLENFSNKKILVPLIEVSHYQIYQVLLIAKALEVRGAEVKILVCDSVLPACEIRSVRNVKVNPCLDCKMNASNILPEYNLDTIKLSDVISNHRLKKLNTLAYNLANDYSDQHYYNGVDIVRMVDDSVVRYFYGGVPETGSSALGKVRQRYIATALIGLEAAKAICDSWSPDIVFGSMEVYADWAPYHQYMTMRGKRSVTVSISQFNFHSLLLSQNELYRSNERYLNWLSKRKTRDLTSGESVEINSFISKRFQGDSAVFKQYGFFSGTDESLEDLKIDPQKRNIFLFSNVYWDVGMSEFGELYTGVLEWVVSTIEIIKEYPDCHLYVKPHPSESFDVKSAKGVVDEIYKHFPILPKNLTLILPEMQIRTYRLFKYIDVGLVYNGTLGLEMLFEDIPVIATGKTPYSDINLVNQPDTKVEYEKLLLGEATLIKPKREEVMKFAYFYFIKTLVPWKLTNAAYGDDFVGYNINDILDIAPGKDYFLDHICTSIIESDETNIDSW